MDARKERFKKRKGLKCQMQQRRPGRAGGNMPLDSARRRSLATLAIVVSEVDQDRNQTVAG